MSVEAGNAAGLHVSQPSNGFPPSPFPAYQWVWADATARLAQVVTAAQIGGVGYQQDLQAQFRLLAVSPSKRWGELAYSDVALWRSTVGVPGTAVTVAGLSGALTLGSQLGTVPTPTNKSTQLIKTGLVTTAVPGQLAVYRANATTTPATTSGFRYRFQFTLTAPSASWRWFVGLCATGFAVDVDPATLTDIFGVGRGNGEANVQLYHNDNAGAAVQVDLGAAFPAAVANTIYDLELFFPVGGAQGVFQLYNMASAAEVSHAYASDIPTVTTSMLWQLYMTNHTDAQIVNIGLGSLLQGQLYR